MNLQLTNDSIDRLKNLEQTSKDLENLSTLKRPSEIVMSLRQHAPCTLMLIAVKSCRTVRRHILQYFTQWMNIKSIVDGNDLKALGYKPGRQFKVMLDGLLAATLDGEICDRSQAEAFLRHNFPQ